MRICLHNGTLLNGFSQMENCAVVINDGTIEDVFSEERFSQHEFSSFSFFL